MSTATTLPERAELPIERTWDASSVFPDDAAWESALNDLINAIPTIERYRGRLGDDAQTLAEWLQYSAEITSLIMKAYIYASMFYTVDTADQAAAAKMGRVSATVSRVRAALSFATPEILAIGFETLRRWVDETAELQIYAHSIDQLEREQAHVRSAEVEQVAALADEPFSAARQAYSQLTNADLQFAPATDVAGNEYPVAQSTIGNWRTHHDRTLRRTAYESYADAYLTHKNTIAALYNSSVQADVFDMRVHRYDSSLAVRLEPHNIPATVFHNLIDVFRANLPTWHRYWEIRRRALKLDTLAYYDEKAPLTAQKPEVPYETAVEWIAAGMAPLGDEYVATLRRGCLEERWVDVYPNQGKRQGAFSSGTQGTNPFIMMSYVDDLFSLSTLAHELGHSMHSYLTWQHQPPVYARYSLFVAEVASNFNQALVRDYLFRNNDDPVFQIALIEEAMSNFHRYFFIMPTLARFELAMHERVENGQPLTAEILNNACADLFEEAYGPDVALDRERIGSTWAQFGHLYRSFYVYQYATGISGAHALARGVAAGEPGAAERYLDFLSAGSSVYPLDALKTAGVDLTTPAPVEAAFADLAGYVDRLEALIDAA